MDYNVFIVGGTVAGLNGLANVTGNRNNQVVSSVGRGAVAAFSADACIQKKRGKPAPRVERDHSEEVYI